MFYRITDYNILVPLGIATIIALVWTLLFLIIPCIQHRGINRRMKELSIREISKQENMLNKKDLWILCKNYELNISAEKLREKLIKQFSTKSGLPVLINNQGNLEILGTSRKIYNVNYVNPLDFSHIELQLKSNGQYHVILICLIKFEKFIKFFLWFHAVLLVFLFISFLFLSDNFGTYGPFYILLVTIYVLYFAISRYRAQILSTDNFISKQLIHTIIQ